MAMRPIRAVDPRWCVHVPPRVQWIPSWLVYAVYASCPPNGPLGACATTVRLTIRSHVQSPVGPTTVFPYRGSCGTSFANSVCLVLKIDVFDSLMKLSSLP